jgi:hypothetical protein
VVSPFPGRESTTYVTPVQSRHDSVTERMRARMTEGASRERVADGRVVLER